MLPRRSPRLSNEKHINSDANSSSTGSVNRADGQAIELRCYLQDRNHPSRELFLLFDVAYKGCLQAIVGSDDRPQFDFATVELVAQFRTEHIFFWGKWLDKDNQLMGLRIDNKADANFFPHWQRYISASSVTAQRHNLFLLP
jgi:hypothetical protein